MSSFSVAYRGHTARRCTRASRGLVDLKPRKQIISNFRFEPEIKLVRLNVNSISQYFAISSQLRKATILAELKLCQREEIVMIYVCRERILSQNRMKRKRMSDRKKQEVKESESRKTDKKVREDTKIGRIR